MQGIKFRYAKMSDFRSLLRESEAEWPGWWEKNYKFGIKYTKDRITGKRAIVAVSGRRIIGFLMFGSIWSRHTHIEDLYVQCKYRRMGVASGLLEKLIEISRKTGIRKIVAECDPSDKPVHKLNVKNGFRRAGYIKRLWGDTDAIVFTKDLRG
ncbi:GNAT family N-acetyltransferase [Candidatus Parvarchaeota archaeon]|nr:GNAT family N-acetyltransferase [Candidatus Parvarchaeota archaeon]